MTEVSHRTIPPSQGYRRSFLEFSDSADTMNWPTKRRASQACGQCRSRRVRCNLVSTGPPCTNCRLEGARCVILEDRRRNMDPSLNSRDGYTERSYGTTSSPLSHNGATPLNLGSFGSCSPCDFNDMVIESRGFSFATFDASSRLQDPCSVNVGPQRSLAQDRKLSCISRLPHYLSPLPDYIDLDDAAFLKRKGALSIPGTTLRNELLKNYVEYVHSSLPILDLNDFLQRVDQFVPDGGGISLLLFQAVMFSGAASVDEHLLIDAGYPNRTEARKQLFQKCKLLYDFDYETNSTSRLQSLILMTDWHDAPDEQKNTGYWVHLAISLALKLKLNDSNGHPDLKAQFKGICKRIWWACCMRHSLIAAAMRRPVYIKEEDYDIPMLTLDDFDIVALPDNVSCIPMDCSVARNLDQQRQLAELCIQRARVCQLINRISETAYIASTNQQAVAAGEQSPVVETTPRTREPGTNLQQLIACHGELQQWLDGLPTASQRGISSQNESVDQDPVLCVNRDLLHMIFYAALSALHTPQSPATVQTGAPGNSMDLDSLQSEDSRRQVERAAIEITKIARDLQMIGFVKYLTRTSAAVIRPALVFHLIRMKTLLEGVGHRASRKSFTILLEVMNTHRAKYPAAEFTLSYLDAAIWAILKEPAQARSSEQLLATNIVPGISGSPQPDTNPSDYAVGTEPCGSGDFEGWHRVDSITSIGRGHETQSDRLLDIDFDSMINEAFDHEEDDEFLNG